MGTKRNNRAHGIIVARGPRPRKSTRLRERKNEPDSRKESVRNAMERTNGKKEDRDSKQGPLVSDIILQPYVKAEAPGKKMDQKRVKDGTCRSQPMLPMSGRKRSRDEKAECRPHEKKWELVSEKPEIET